MRGMIGGSSLDDLRHIINIPSIYTDDVKYELVKDESVDITNYNCGIEKIYGISSGETFVASYAGKKYKYCIINDDEGMRDDWQLIEENK